MSSLVVGLGAHRYSVARPRLKQSEQLLLDSLSDATVVEGQLVVLRRKSPELIVFDQDGRFDRAVPVSGVTLGHGIRYLGHSDFAITDLDGHKVLVIHAEFEEVRRFDCGNLPNFQRPFNHPTDCTRSADGRYYIADGYGNSVVHAFSPKGELIHTFGEPGSRPGQFSTPHAILVDHQQRVCVADRENDRIQRFTLDGEFLDEIRGLHKPMALEVLADGTLLCTDQTPRLSAYSPDGRLIGRCRTFGTYGHGLAVTPDGSIIIVEMIPDGVSILRPL
jgi:hypothetical protein